MTACKPGFSEDVYAVFISRTVAAGQSFLQGKSSEMYKRRAFSLCPSPSPPLSRLAAPNTGGEILQPEDLRATIFAPALPYLGGCDSCHGASDNINSDQCRRVYQPPPPQRLISLNKTFIV